MRGRLGFTSVGRPGFARDRGAIRWGLDRPYDADTPHRSLPEYGCARTAAAPAFRRSSINSKVATLSHFGDTAPAQTLLRWSYVAGRRVVARPTESHGTAVESSPADALDDRS